MYKISEAAEKLGVSRQAVYQRIDRLTVELSEHIKKKKGVKYITEDGFKIISEQFADKQECDNEDKQTDNVVNNTDKGDNETVNPIEIEMFKRLIEEKERYIKQLETDKQELVKDKTDLKRMLEQSQMLMMKDKEQIIYLEHKLEDKNDPTDQEESQENEAPININCEENQEQSKTFWNRITNVFKSS